MTTIVDPSGTPSVIYNRSGTTVVDLVGNGSTQGGATSIPRSSGVTIALVDATAGNTSVVLPDDAQIGDVVEVYSLNDFNSSAADVFPPSGERINQLAQDLSIGVYGAIFRKLTATRWGVTKGA